MEPRSAELPQAPTPLPQQWSATVAPSSRSRSPTPLEQTPAARPAPTVNTAPLITTQPANQTVNAGQTASFSVTASGTGPLTYQWFKNGTAIGGATSSTYKTPATVSGDSGSHFTVTVTNTGGTVTSAPATLTVNTSDDYYPTGKPDRSSRADGNLQRSCNGHRSTHVPVVQRRSRHWRSHFEHLYNAGNSDRQQQFAVHRDCDQRSRNSHEYRGHFDSDQSTPDAPCPALQ